MAPLAPRWRWLSAGIALLLAVAVIAGIALIPRAPPDSTAAGARLPNRSIVILPFEDPGGSADEAWFVDAVTRELTTSVGRHKDTLVIGRGTAELYKGKAVDPRIVARELGVRYVVRGWVRRDGERVRLDVAMVDGESGAEQWTRQYDVERARLRETIGDISGGLGKTLFVEMSTSVGQRVARLKPDEVEADDLAMRGYSVYLKSVSADSFAEARQLFERAVAKDPNSVRALSGLSMVSSFGVSMNYWPDRDAAIRRSEEALARLDSVDANHLLTLLARASLVNMRADWEGQYAIARTLMEQYPNEPTAYHHHCSSTLRLGRHAEGIPSCQRAIRVSPRDSRVGIWWGCLAFHQYLVGQYASAAANARESVAAMPKHPFYGLLLAASLVELGRKAEAEQIVRDYMARNPGFETANIPTTMWPAGAAGHSSFVAGRDRIAATLRSLGMP
jgi:TolB-like protein/tetratricopeptide (TPR) repeat protein